MVGLFKNLSQKTPKYLEWLIENTTRTDFPQYLITEILNNIDDTPDIGWADIKGY